MSNSCTGNYARRTVFTADREKNRRDILQTEIFLLNSGQFSQVSIQFLQFRVEQRATTPLLQLKGVGISSFMPTSIQLFLHYFNSSPSFLWSSNLSDSLWIPVHGLSYIVYLFAYPVQFSFINFNSRWNLTSLFL
jgi:hypothetical protein